MCNSDSCDSHSLSVLGYLKDLQGPGRVGNVGALTVYDFATGDKVTLTTRTAGTAI